MTLTKWRILLLPKIPDRSWSLDSLDEGADRGQSLITKPKAAETS
jgi:hypothetical protein